MPISETLAEVRLSSRTSTIVDSSLATSPRLQNRKLSPTEGWAVCVMEPVLNELNPKSGVS
jgi:hypothetical protein